MLASLYYRNLIPLQQWYHLYAPCSTDLTETSVNEQITTGESVSNIVDVNRVFKGKEKKYAPLVHLHYYYLNTLLVPAIVYNMCILITAVLGIIIFRKPLAPAAANPAANQRRKAGSPLPNR